MIFAVARAMQPLARMSDPKSKSGKPTIDPAHHANSGERGDQREERDDDEKPTIAPEDHDSNVGQRGGVRPPKT